jgi:hypothetical protein
MPEVEPVLLAGAGGRAVAESVTWPTMPVVDVGGPPELGAASAALAALAGVGGSTGVVVVADAPDLPALTVGKVFSALTSVEVAACPAAGGGLVAIGTRLPAPDWLARSGLDVDAPDALERLRAAAPRPRGLTVTPGWHRVRGAEDAARLDPGLEGWAATRAWLASH